MVRRFAKVVSRFSPDIGIKFLSIDVESIALDANGRVIITDAQLNMDAQDIGSFTAAGGSNQNCFGATNGNCNNSGCSGNTNGTCQNASCMDTNGECMDTIDP